MSSFLTASTVMANDGGDGCRQRHRKSCNIWDANIEYRITQNVLGG